MELGNTVQTGTEQKGIKAFHQLKTLAKDSIIKGVHQGRFESKKTPGYFFHVFHDVDGEAYAYGTCQAFDDKVNEVLAKQVQLGRKLYMEIKFNGRVRSKKNPTMTYYSFTTQKLVEVMGPEGELTAPAPAPASDAITSSDVPF